VVPNPAPLPLTCAATVRPFLVAERQGIKNKLQQEINGLGTKEVSPPGFLRSHIPGKGQGQGKEISIAASGVILGRGRPGRIDFQRGADLKFPGSFVPADAG